MDAPLCGDDPELDSALVALKVATAAWPATVADPGQQHPHRADNPLHNSLALDRRTQRQ